MTKKLSKAQKAKARTRQKSTKNLAKDGQSDRAGTEPVSDSEPYSSVLSSRRRAAAIVEGEESVFSKMTSTQLAQLNLIAAYAPLARPVPAAFVHFDRRLLAPTRLELEEQLTLPKRPRWNRDLDSKIVQCNEAEIFRQWLLRTDAVFAQAFPPLNIPDDQATDQIAQFAPQGTAIVPSLFERNIEVYRQLWRVNERSHITCILLDSRCPLLHLPHSLVNHLKRFARFKTILVLTKADVVPAHIVQRWKTWLEHQHPSFRVVVTESYIRKEQAEGQGKRARYAPYLSPSSRHSFFEALKAAHGDLITPPPNIRNDPTRLKSWIPPCPLHIDWTAVASFDADLHLPLEQSHQVEDVEPPPESSAYVTIGLIGQPNVGKSSLLNALVGAKVVRASKTPGKTKHFQTHFLGPKGSASGIQLCDSPGLVFPSLVGLEMQVLGAVLPISQVQAMSLCVRFAGDRIPLERVLQLSEAPESDAGPAAVSRLQQKQQQQQQQQRAGDLTKAPASWTALDILESLAARAGYRTAKAARWDTNRAGNALMRQLAEAKIRWAFQPPSEDQDAFTSAGEEQTDFSSVESDGIWLGMTETELDGESETDEETDSQREPSHPERSVRKTNFKAVRFDDTAGAEPLECVNNDEEVDEDDDNENPGGSTSLFAVLEVEDGADESESEDESDEELSNHGVYEKERG